MSDCTIPLPELTGCVINGRNSNGTETAPPTTLPGTTTTVVVEATPPTPPDYGMPIPDYPTATTYVIGLPPEPIQLPATGAETFGWLALALIGAGICLRSATRRKR